jgi:hypothetical protein
LGAEVRVERTISSISVRLDRGDHGVLAVLTVLHLDLQLKIWDGLRGGCRHPVGGISSGTGASA